MADLINHPITPVITTTKTDFNPSLITFRQKSINDFS
jgi:hypothetical protein